MPWAGVEGGEECCGSWGAPCPICDTDKAIAYYTKDAANGAASEIMSYLTELAHVAHDKAIADALYNAADDVFEGKWRDGTPIQEILGAPDRNPTPPIW